MFLMFYAEVLYIDAVTVLIKFFRKAYDYNSRYSFRSEYLDLLLIVLSFN